MQERLMPHNTTSAQLLLEVTALKVIVEHLISENGMMRDALLKYGSGALAIRDVERKMQAVRSAGTEPAEPD